MEIEYFTRWNPADVANAERLRGPFRGCVAVVALYDGENCYSSLMTSDRADARDAADDLLARLSPGELLYAVVPSCDPGKVRVEAEPSLEDEELDWSYKAFGGRVFAIRLPDAMLDNVRRAALKLFAEQGEVTFVCRRGTATA